MAKKLDGIFSPNEEQEEENLDPYFEGDDRPAEGPYDPDMPKDPEDSYDDEFADDPNFYDYDENYGDAAGEPQKDQRSSGDAAKENKLDKAKDAAEKVNKTVKTAEKAEAAEGMVATILGGLGIEATPIAIGCAVILIVVVLVVIISLAFMAIGNLDRAEGSETGGGSLPMCSIEIPSKPRSDGYYIVPEPSQVGNAYDLNANGGSPRDQQWGKPELVKVIVAVAQKWHEAHPNVRMAIGDLDAPGHASHTLGEDVDIYSNDGIFVSYPGHSNNPNYKREYAIELGKLFLDTKIIDKIGYAQDSYVNGVLNKYAKEVGYSDDPMADWSGHDDHFHVRIHPEKFKSVCASAKETEAGDATVVTGDYKTLQKEFLALNKKGTIKTDSQGPVNDVKNAVVKEQTLRTTITLAKYAASKGAHIRISVFKTGHDKFSAGGSVSHHWLGRAVDIGNEEDAGVLMPYLNKNKEKLKLDDLIFDNSLIGKSSNYYNLDKGKPFKFSSDTLSGHRDHIHISTFE